MVTEKLVTGAIELIGKKVIVAGAGRSGLASSGLLIRNGANGAI